MKRLPLQIIAAAIGLAGVFQTSARAAEKLDAAREAGKVDVPHAKSGRHAKPIDNPATLTRDGIIPP